MMIGYATAVLYVYTRHWKVHIMQNVVDLAIREIKTPRNLVLRFLEPICEISSP